MNRPVNCGNPLCTNEAVSAAQASANRALCAPCEVAYQMGLQHGHMEQHTELAALVKALKALKRRLRK
jgi:hypothetical protein